ncbi:hypothetical protein J8Z26_21765 [Vibrio sp. SCSIO 43169]|nr:hypothetical protein [Vibrio sp. SCSIO 43169]
MNLIITIACGVLSSIAAVIAIVGAFPSQMTTEQQFQLSIGIIGWFLGLCFYIAYITTLRKMSSLKRNHYAELKAVQAEHSVEKMKLERDLAKGYENYFSSELGKTSTALVYTSKLLNSESPIPRAVTPQKGNPNEI